MRGLNSPGISPRLWWYFPSPKHLHTYCLYDISFATDEVPLIHSSDITASVRWKQHYPVRSQCDNLKLLFSPFPSVTHCWKYPTSQSSFVLLWYKRPKISVDRDNQAINRRCIWHCQQPRHCSQIDKAPWVRTENNEKEGWDMREEQVQKWKSKVGNAAIGNDEETRMDNGITITQWDSNSDLRKHVKPIMKNARHHQYTGQLSGSNLNAL